MKSKIILKGVIILLLMFVVSGCAKNIPKENLQEIIIASANPMSADLKEAGDMKVKAIELAFDEVNNDGGIDGRKLKLLIEDDAGSAKVANQIAQKLVNDANVIGVIGHWNTAAMLATRNAYNSAGIPTITDSVNKSITDGTTPYIFRIVANDKAQAEGLAEYCLEKMKFKKVAIVYVNNDYSKGLKEYFREKLQNSGGEITAIEVFMNERTTDFTLELSKIKNSTPDGIFIAAYPKETAIIVRQARELGIKVPIVGTDAIASMELIRLGGAAVEEIRFNSSFHEDMKDEGAKRFINAFKTRYGCNPDSTAALAYDSAQIMIAGIRKNGPSREGIYQYMNGLMGYNGITGKITFDDHHDIESAIKILTVKDGKFILDNIQP